MIGDNFILFSLKADTKIKETLPKYEFFKVVLESAKEIFTKTHEYLGYRVDYSYELALINKLENELNYNYIH